MLPSGWPKISCERGQTSSLNAPGQTVAGRGTLRIQVACRKTSLPRHQIQLGLPDRAPELEQRTIDPQFHNKKRSPSRTTFVAPKKRVKIVCPTTSHALRVDLTKLHQVTFHQRFAYGDRLALGINVLIASSITWVGLFTRLSLHGARYPNPVDENDGSNSSDYP